MFLGAPPLLHLFDVISSSFYGVSDLFYFLRLDPFRFLFSPVKKRGEGLCVFILFVHEICRGENGILPFSAFANDRAEIAFFCIHFVRYIQALLKSYKIY